MRCKRHICDSSSAVGVCATCLREHLFALITAQGQAALPRSLPADAPRKSDPQPPPPPDFPRSVSPYITRRKCDEWPSADHHQGRPDGHRHRLPDRRFFSTPQAGPTHENAPSTKKTHGKFSLFSVVFRSKTDKPPREASSPKWLSSVIPGRRKKSPLRQNTLRNLHSGGVPDRGMSPEYWEQCEESEGSSRASGYSSEARRTPARRRGQSGQLRNAPGLAFCLSPLVRASPTRRKALPPEAAYSGELRGLTKSHLSAAAASGANRSRKLVDFGRFNRNHRQR